MEGQCRPFLVKEEVSRLVNVLKQKTQGPLKVGDTVIYGNYPQTKDGGVLPIEWQVIEVEEGKVLVISKYALDCKTFHTQKKGTWESCTLRSWLNNEFVQAAFSKEEKAGIQSATMTGEENPKYNANPGKAATDKVFILSLSEALKYFTEDKERLCRPTEYAAAQGASPGDDGHCWWWVRTPGIVNKKSGAIHYELPSVFIDDCTVRPAMWIKL